MTSLKQMRRVYLMVALLVAVGLWLTGAVQAKTINVTPGHSIQAAINVAVKGDVVVVAKGTYKERLNFKGKAITVKSANPTDKTVVAATIINGDKKGSVVTFKTGEKATSVLTGFTITNGSGTLVTVPGHSLKCGGGILCQSASPTLSNNTIKSNSTGAGGGVMCQKSSPTLTNNTISGNSTTMPGGGVMCYDHSAPKLTNNIISGNSAGDTGGGVFCEQFSSPTLTGNIISGNSTSESGGGVACANSSSPTLTKNTIRDNKATGSGGGGGGGVSVSQASSPTLTNNTISGNVSSSGGAGINVGQASATITNNIISGNTGTATGGGGISFSESSGTITNNTIRGNAASDGGGLNIDRSSVTLTNNVISGNTATATGGGIAYLGTARTTIANNTISGNSAGSFGGGIATSASPIISNNIIAFSTGGSGVWPWGGGAAPKVTYCDVYGNAGGDYLDMPNQTGKNGNISKNPLFAWAAHGDFHEKSKGGRWNGSAWVKDTVQSPCINAGNPASAFALEPAPNGGRINMGAYGNTKYASKSAPKSAAGGLLVSAAAAPASGGGAQLSVNLSAAASVEVTITNLAGRPVATLPESDLPKGVSTLLWSGKGTAGLRVPSGTYLARLTARTEDGGQCQALAMVSIQR